MVWVRWTKICVPKKSGGLGIENMELFNMSLLGKWKWRMLTEKKSEWCKLLDRLYGIDEELNARQCSVWWKDIKGIDSASTTRQGWFSGSVKLKLGDGKQVSFWHDKWCGPLQLSELFPRIFELADNQNCKLQRPEFGQKMAGLGNCHGVDHLNPRSRQNCRKIL